LRSSHPAVRSEHVRPPAEAIASLGLVVGVIALVIFVGVEGALVYAVWRYRSSRVDQASRFDRNTRLEVAWTAAPAIVLAAVFALTVGTLSEISFAGAEPGLRIQATAHQWWWEFGYFGVTTANELHVPVGTVVELQLRSSDVIHSFWVPELGGKTDMIPGTTNTLRLLARRAGTYQGQCAEFCGVEHAWMRIQVVAESPNDFTRWLATQGRPAVSGGAGERVFLSEVCVSCHAVRGTTARGTAGPDLTHVGGRATIGAGVLAMDAVNMRAWLADPQQYKPGSLMPRVPLSDTELDALATYLVSLK
jgi:cytochrome c oxidase subunit II